VGARPKRSAPRVAFPPWAPVAVTGKGKRWGETGLNQALQQAQRRAGKSGWCYHDLRHFFATELFRRGASAPVVQQLLGHSDLATTQRYADIVASDRRAAIALFDDKGNVEGGVLC
jgi:site-specific recombinase XerD